MDTGSKQHVTKVVFVAVPVAVVAVVVAAFCERVLRPAALLLLSFVVVEEECESSHEFFSVMERSALSAD